LIWLTISLSSSLQKLNKVVANIPYNITGPILEKLEHDCQPSPEQFECIVLLVQKK